MKACTRCGAAKDVDGFHRDITKPSGRATICKACVSTRQKANREVETEERRMARRVYAREYARTRSAERRETYARLRDVAITAYGGKCSCCGEPERRFLTIDHVGEWGAEHRASDSVASSMVMWLHRNGYPQDGRFQLLCWNCNCARGAYGSCPHEAFIDPDAGRVTAEYKIWLDK